VPPDRLDEYAATVGNTPTAYTRRLIAMRHRQWLSYNERRLQLRRRWEVFFTQWDAILLPVMPCPAIPHDHSEPMAARTTLVSGKQRPYWDLITWMAPAGACYLPATVIPVGLKNGLPVGIQIVGAYLDDRTTLDLADQMLTLLGSPPRPPGF
jgi:amidase